MGVLINEDRMGVVTIAINPASVATITTAEQTFTIPGLKVGDFVSASKGGHTTGVVVGSARVSAADTLAIQFVNPTAGGVDAASETWLIFWFRPEKTAAVVNP